VTVCVTFASLSSQANTHGSRNSPDAASWVMKLSPYRVTTGGTVSPQSSVPVEQAPLMRGEHAPSNMQGSLIAKHVSQGLGTERGQYNTHMNATHEAYPPRSCHPDTWHGRQARHNNAPIVMRNWLDMTLPSPDDSCLTWSAAKVTYSKPAVALATPNAYAV